MRLANALLVCLALGAGALSGHGAWGAEEVREQATGLATLAHPEETPEVLPPGQGREEAFYACTACHGTAIIRRSRLGRQQWDDLMDWMVEKHGMVPLEGEQRRLVVDYLSAAFPPSAGVNRRGANPFLAD